MKNGDIESKIPNQIPLLKYLPLMNSTQEIRVFRLFQSDDCTFHSAPARNIDFSIYSYEIFFGFSLIMIIHFENSGSI